MKLAQLNEVAKNLIDPNFTTEYTRGICELIAEFIPNPKGLDHSERASQVSKELGVKGDIYGVSYLTGSKINAELLEALRDITETFESCLGGSDPLYYEDFKKEIEGAKAAIAKAEGTKS